MNCFSLIFIMALAIVPMCALSALARPSRIDSDDRTIVNGGDRPRRHRQKDDPDWNKDAAIHTASAADQAAALALVSQAKASNRELDAESTVDYATKAIAKDRYCLQAYMLRSQGNFGLGNKKAAFADLDFVMAHVDEKHMVGALRQRADANLALKKYSVALADTDKIEQWMQRNGKRLSDGMHLLRADCFTGLNQPGKAAKELTFAIEIKPEESRLLLRRAKAYTECHQLEKALADYTALIKLDQTNDGLLGSDTDIYMGRAQVYDLMGKKNLADLDRKRASVHERLNVESAPFRLKH